ncbi:hypothetical protein [Nocardia crassostreae]|uniref:hypothetical protein n=1 Tax=Nocardia crassostreae TaxID=53428 RepID=UPI0008297548|nr:hypothetical protein [Nocardia crassostreae]
MKLLLPRAIQLFDRLLVLAGLIVGARMLLGMAADELASRRELESGLRAKVLTAVRAIENKKLQEAP